MVSHRVARTMVMAGVAAVIAWMAGPAVAAERHSGSVVSIDQQAQTLVVKELGAEGKPETLAVKVEPGTKVVVSERDPQAPDFERQFTERPIGLGEIQAGDFVVVEISGDGTTRSAESVMVTLRRGS